MPRYKVIVSRLNQRKFPVEDMADESNVVGKVFKDFEFDGELALTNKLGDWHKDTTDNFYWGGGIKSASELDKISFPNSEPNAEWLNLLGIAEAWKKSKGEGVNIAILDSGINLNNPEISENLFQYSPEQFLINDNRVCRNFLNNTNDVSDFIGHGSHCGSLISSKNSTSIIGLAPESKLFVGKVTDQGEFNGFKALVQAVTWAANTKEVDIISISLGSSDESDNDFNNLRDAMSLAFQNNKIVIAAIGDNINDTKPLFPALFTDFCISVGATDKQGHYWNGNVETEITNIYAPGVDIISNGTARKVSMNGNSQSAAIVTGIVALFISFLKKQRKTYTSKGILKALLDNSENVLDRPEKSLINPAKLFLNL